MEDTIHLWVFILGECEVPLLFQLRKILPEKPTVILH